MISAPPRKFCCDFCSRPRDAMGDDVLLFVPQVGGRVIAICGDCATGFAQIAEAHRSNPHLAAAMIEAHNAIAAARKDAGA